MKIWSTFRISCCGSEAEFEDEHVALGALLNHIVSRHHQLYEQLDAQARELARSENGHGYFDSDHCNGWDAASRQFREAWRQAALLEHLKEGE